MRNARKFSRSSTHSWCPLIGKYKSSHRRRSSAIQTERNSTPLPETPLPRISVSSINTGYGCQVSCAIPLSRDCGTRPRESARLELRRDTRYTRHGHASLVRVHQHHACRVQHDSLEGLGEVRVGDVMSRDCAIVQRNAVVSDLAEEVLRTGRRCFFIADNDRVAGMVTPQELRAVPRDRPSATLAAETIRPVRHLNQVDSAAPRTQALEPIRPEDAD